MAWARNLLRVDLSKGPSTNEPLNMEWAQKYLGQRGLATKYFVEEVDPKVDPLSPKNKMIMTTGPLTGTSASTAGRYSVVTKGALTGAIACSNSGGFFGNELKNAGYDMIIFEGKSDKPVYLMIENDSVQILDAAEFWGESVWDTEEGIKTKHGDPLIRVASIGVSGEQGVKFACIVNDMDRAAGRSGVGTVMGSKNLKAVAVRGTLGVAVDDSKSFMAAAAAGKEVWRGDNYGHGQVLLAQGHLVIQCETGEIALATASPNGHQEIARLPSLTGKTWNNPTLAGGRLYLRNSREMICYNIARGSEGGVTSLRAPKSEGLTILAAAFLLMNSLGCLGLGLASLRK